MTTTTHTLTGKVAVMTGGSSGIGFAAAQQLVAAGAYIFSTGRRQDALEAAVAQLGHNVTAVQGDIANLDDLDRLYRTVAADKAGAERTVAEMTSHGGKGIAIQADVARAADVQRLFEATTHVFGAVDVLVNNAGVFQFEPFAAITAQEFHREFDTNVLGPILAIQEALQHCPASGASQACEVMT
jgi:NAD(P)-dependent dehydrogenase (short-subunit alcohol dehydrogenase family)